MSSEATPLLRSSPDPDVLEHERVYERFSVAEKRVIVAIVSWAGLMPLFVSGSFVPSIPEIARELGSTGAVVNLAVSISVFSTAIGNLFWATYAGYYGRRPVYLFSLPCLCIGSVGVALSRSIPELLICRVVQAFGASSGLSVGAAVIGDIYKLEERGGAMGIFFAACLLGPALAPLAGGAASQYSSWRFMQLAIFFASFAAFLVNICFLPETSHPNTRGIDKEPESEQSRRFFKLLNPLECLLLLRSPNLLGVTLASTFILITDYVLLIPLSYTIGVRYGIHNAALVGACFLPSGLGNAIGAPLSGIMSDQTVIKWRTKRGGEWYPEDRLRTALPGALLMAPISTLVSGLITQFVDGKLGIVLNLICLFINGIGIDFMLSPASAYYVDVMHNQSAEISAAATALRSMILAFAIAGILPLIDAIGVAGTNAIAAFIAWLGFGLVWLVIRYGTQMRNWVDIGYSTTRDN